MSHDSPIIVVGAGLVGSLLSCFLAKRGHRVHVYERNVDIRESNAAAGKSINLALSERGLHALSQVGLKEEVLKIAIPMRGR
jgi:kynurenine 3-monooxygenase